MRFPLESIRTDGWFERVGEGIGSFQALCDIIGARFFAFAMITGARITALTVDRRDPENTLVEFAVGPEGSAGSDDVQRLTLAEFRTRLVDALLVDEPLGDEPTRETDMEAVQLHLGVRYLLLAPLYGYSLVELRVDEDGSFVTVLADGVEQTYPLVAFQVGLRTHVREELQRAGRGGQRGAIDLERVTQAREAAAQGEHVRVLELLAGWPAPLAIFLRTPEGQLLGLETRATIAEGLGHLGSSCIALGESSRGEEILRLAIQYAGEGRAAADAYQRLGHAILLNGRPGEAMGPLRRAVVLSVNIGPPLSLLAEAYLARGRLLAAHAAATQALRCGADQGPPKAVLEQVEERIGAPLAAWRAALKSA